MKIDTCDICFEENEEIFGDCCGVKTCINCNSRFADYCCICEKNKIYEPRECSGCLSKVPLISIGVCDNCDEIFCEDCLYWFNPPICICFKKECIEEYEKGFREWMFENILKKISSKRIQKKWRDFKSVK